MGRDGVRETGRVGRDGARETGEGGGSADTELCVSVSVCVCGRVGGWAGGRVAQDLRRAAACEREELLEAVRARDAELQQARARYIVLTPTKLHACWKQALPEAVRRRAAGGAHFSMACSYFMWSGVG